MFDQQEKCKDQNTAKQFEVPVDGVENYFQNTAVQYFSIFL